MQRKHTTTVQYAELWQWWQCAFHHQPAMHQLNACAGNANAVSLKVSGSSSVAQYCCDKSGYQPVLLGSPYVIDCTCSAALSSVGAAGALRIYFGEFATLGGCDSTSAAACSTCCLDAAPVTLWGTYSSPTGLGIQHPDSMTLTAHWQCPGQPTHVRSVSMAYSPLPANWVSSPGSWLLNDMANNVEMLYGQTYSEDLFDLYTTGTERTCLPSHGDLGGDIQYHILQQILNLTTLTGTWSGFSAKASFRSSQPNDCYRVGALKFYADPTASSGISVDVTYVRHDTIMADPYWASQRSPVVLSAEPVTSTARLQMLLPTDPSGVAHMVAAIYASGTSEPITLHGTNSKCNARFLAMSSWSRMIVQAAAGNTTSFAMRMYSARTNSTGSDVDTLVRECATNALVDSTLVTGNTGACFAWINGKFAVVQFTLDDVLVLYQYEDSVCQNRTVTTGEQFVFHSGNVGKCSPFGVLDGKMTYAIVQHAPDQLQAAAAVARMEHHGTIPSSTGGGAVTAEMIRWISVLMHRQHRFQSQLSASLLV